MKQRVTSLFRNPGEATCIAQPSCGSALHGIVVKSEAETVSVDPGEITEVGDYVVLHGDNTVPHPQCVGYTHTVVVAAVLGRRSFGEPDAGL